jgi:hypothetical protein
MRWAALLLTAAVAAQEVPILPPSPVPALLQMLDSELAAVRRAAAESIAALPGQRFRGTPCTDAIEPLRRHFAGERDEGTASAMALALLELGAAPAEPQPVGWRAIAARAARGGAPPDDAQTQLADRDALVRFWAAQLLQRSEAAALPADAVVPWLADERLAVRLRAIQAVPRLAQLPPGVPRQLVRALLTGDRDTQAANAVLLQLGSRAVPAVPDLAALLTGKGSERPDDQVLSLAVQVLGAIGPDAAPAVPALVASTDRVPNDVGSALARIAPAAGVHGLMELWERDRERGEETWWPSASALSMMGDAASSELARFVAAIERGPRAATANALHVLTAFGNAGRPAEPMVLRVLERPDGWLSWLAKDALLAMQADPKVVLPAVQRAFAADPSSRGALLQGLHRLGADAEKFLIEAYADPPLGLIADAELAGLPDLSPAGVDFVIGRLRDIDPRFRMSMGRGLAKCFAEQQHVPAALRARLPDLLGHDDFYIRLPVAQVLARAFDAKLPDQRSFYDLVQAGPDAKAFGGALADAASFDRWLHELAGRDTAPALRDAAKAVLAERQPR